MSRKQVGFSLMEIIVGLGIMAILASSAVPVAHRVSNSMKASSTNKEMQKLEAGLTDGQLYLPLICRTGPSPWSATLSMILY